ARMRELLYYAYLRFPRAFFDRHATGQVLSRATNDLYPIRYFIGWGLVQGMQSLMMIVAAGIVLVIVNPRLALYTAVAMPPITLLALRFARRHRAAARAQGAEAPAARTARRPLRSGGVRIRRRGRRAARPRPGRRAGRDRRGLRPDRLRENLPAQPPAPLLRPHGRAR